MIRFFAIAFLACFSNSTASAEYSHDSFISVTAQSNMGPGTATTPTAPTEAPKPFSEVVAKLVFLAIVALTIVGIIYGVTNRAVFYMDRNDMTFSCTPYISVLVGVFVTMITDWKFLFWLALIIALILVVCIITKSFDYNKTPFMSISTGVAKLVLSFLVVMNMVSALTPSGNTSSKRRYNRNSALVWLMFLTPLVYVLINGEKVLAQRRAMLSAGDRMVPVNETK
ncbi:MAG: hypothetical protein EG826_17750 [Deltaproteobacteria bacterium]|nr:hypothetical protein [Deltaproteobacteria bacterium]